MKREAELEANLDYIREAPTETGVLELVVRRPREDEREVLIKGVLNEKEGLVGDSWKDRFSSSTPDGTPNPETQINLMNSRSIETIASSKEDWPKAGDQLYINMDISHTNLPAGSRLAIGSAIIEITEKPHNGCKKFAQRYGVDSMKFVNSPDGKELRLRGANARVVQAGVISAGDQVEKL